ncbi:MAG: hypothetical protein Q9211_001193 [Gyalolechia sp. 1 TL-2023]
MAGDKVTFRAGGAAHGARARRRRRRRRSPLVVLREGGPARRGRSRGRGPALGDGAAMVAMASVGQGRQLQPSVDGGPEDVFPFGVGDAPSAHALEVAVHVSTDPFKDQVAKSSDLVFEAVGRYPGAVDAEPAAALAGPWGPRDVRIARAASPPAAVPRCARIGFRPRRRRRVGWRWVEESVLDQDGGEIGIDDQHTEEKCPGSGEGGEKSEGHQGDGDQKQQRV